MKKTNSIVLVVVLMMQLLSLIFGTVSAEDDIAKLPLYIPESSRKVNAQIWRDFSATIDWENSECLIVFGYDSSGRIDKITVEENGNVQEVISITHYDDGTYTQERTVTTLDTVDESTDIPSNESKEITDIPTKEIEFLQENKVLVGDPNGDLRETDQITRAEFVTILCRAIGIEDIAQSKEMKNKEIYVDVPQTHWAIGYINAATEYGAINGVGNGFFCPEMSVTNEQVIKILVAAWGYTEEAEKLGGYPNGYMAVAQQFGITDSVLFNYGLASKRWVVSVFTYNMLSVKPKTTELDLVASTQVEKVEKPFGENGNEYIRNPAEILEKITPETIAYERKVFEQEVPENEARPLKFEGGKIIHIGGTDFDTATMSVNKTSEKQTQTINLKECSEIDITNYAPGDYQIVITYRKNNIEDGYFTNLNISNDGFIFGHTFRVTYLRHQPIIEDQVTEIVLDNHSDYDLPFNMMADSDSNGKVVLCINYPDILKENQYFSYGIVSKGNETIHDKIDGKNAMIEPIIIDNLQFGYQYSVTIGLYGTDGNRNAIKGTLEFEEDNNGTRFTFIGNHSKLVQKGYRIGD